MSEAERQTACGLVWGWSATGLSAFAHAGVAGAGARMQPLTRHRMGARTRTERQRGGGEFGEEPMAKACRTSNGAGDTVDDMNKGTRTGSSGRGRLTGQAGVGGRRMLRVEADAA